MLEQDMGCYGAVDEDAVSRSLVDVFRAAVFEMPYRSISVKLICERAGIGRKAFYQKFGSKRNLLFCVIDAGLVRPEREIVRLLSFKRMSSYAAEMERRMFRAVHDDGEFYRALVTGSPEGAQEFSRVASDAFRALNSELLRDAGYKGDELYAEYVAAYFADAKAQMMRRWIIDGFPLSVDDIADLYSQMALPFWASM